MAWPRDGARPAPHHGLPFIRVEGRPADLPAFVVAPQLADPTPPDIAAFAVTAEEPFSSVLGIEVLANAGNDYLIGAPGTMSPEELPRYLRDHGVNIASAVNVGGFARGIAIGGLWSVLYERVSSS